MARKKKSALSSERILSELAAIGFARATDYISVEEDTLHIRSTDELTQDKAAAIAAIERTGGGIKVKFYDKLKALELLGKQMGMFDGSAAKQAPQNNLLEAILQATQEVIAVDDLPELQQTADTGDDMVE